LLDRFGLCVNIQGIMDPDSRVNIMERRAAFDQDPEAFVRKWEAESLALAQNIRRAARLYPDVTCGRQHLYEIASYCLDVGVDGHRGDIIILKTAKTLAAYEGRTEVSLKDIETAATLALPHRVRRQPLQDIVTDIAAVRNMNKQPANPS
ncbi:MAG: magnesium chelatase ATPase subunit I, partial [Desulfobacteraceae bacterium]|nr:magnesium chelatase ATPase subunit I [Desulfobacteraceae bacterium]